LSLKRHHNEQWQRNGVIWNYFKTIDGFFPTRLPSDLPGTSWAVPVST